MCRSSEPSTQCEAGSWINPSTSSATEVHSQTEEKEEEVEEEEDCPLFSESPAAELSFSSPCTSKCRNCAITTMRATLFINPVSTEDGTNRSRRVTLKRPSRAVMAPESTNAAKTNSGPSWRVKSATATATAPPALLYTAPGQAPETASQSIITQAPVKPTCTGNSANVANAIAKGTTPHAQSMPCNTSQSTTARRDVEASAQHDVEVEVSGERQQAHDDK
mmetsp:Transcript_53207/g.98988  ORF Transcript_53207/g.98988 Transcript_53207/m.98988 type:complete len:221 (-) Transcript_53207:233-895(-)